MNTEHPLIGKRVRYFDPEKDEYDENYTGEEAFVGGVGFVPDYYDTVKFFLLVVTDGGELLRWAADDCTVINPNTGSPA